MSNQGQQWEIPFRALPIQSLRTFFEVRPDSDGYRRAQAILECEPSI